MRWEENVRGINFLPRQGLNLEPIYVKNKNKKLRDYGKN